MNGSDLKRWREAMELTQAELGQRLGKSREAVVGYEKSDKPIPKTVELALLALALGVKSYSGREIILSQFRLEHFETKSGVLMEQLVSVRWGRSKSAERGEIREWLLDREGIEIDQDGVFHVSNEGGLDYEIKNACF